MLPLLLALTLLLVVRVVVSAGAELPTVHEFIEEGTVTAADIQTATPTERGYSLLTQGGK